MLVVYNTDQYGYSVYGSPCLTHKLNKSYISLTSTLEGYVVVNLPKNP